MFQFRSSIRPGEFDMAQNNNTKCSFDSTEFTAAIRRVLEDTSRTIPTVVNQAALNVAGRALNETPKADKAEIQIRLGGMVAMSIQRLRKPSLTRQYKRLFNRYAQGDLGSQHDAPIAGLIVNKRLGLAGKKGLYGAQMRRAIDKLITMRKRSAGFNASGWIPAVKKLAATLPSPFIIARMQGISVIGAKKGAAIPAVQKTISPVATIFNDVKTISRIGSGALERAMGAEGAEMMKHANEKLSRIAL
jgi:hypothetical protein